MKNANITSKDLVSFLSKKSAHESFIQRLKINYRPLICPFEELLHMAQNKKSVFDIGCGAGQFCLLLAEFSQAEKISGVEIKKDLIDEANHLLQPYQKSKEITFYQYDGTNLPPEIKDHDTVFMIDVFHHIPLAFQENFIENLYQKMNTGSTFVFKDIDAKSPLVWMNKLHDLVLSGEVGHELSFDKMLSLLEAKGFKIEHRSKKRMWWYPHFTIVAKK